MNQNNTPHDDLVRKNARMGMLVVGVVITMIGASFAAVPLYSLFCQVTGFGGTTQTADALPDTILDRTMTIKFNADTARDLAWDFRPEQKEVSVHIGQRGLISYSAYNTTNEPLSGTAIYNVTPLKAGKYFHKIQCFCFDKQTLEPGEKVPMPVMFYVDPALADDPNMNDVKVITLSYTFFKAETKALDQAIESFYNNEENNNQHRLFSKD